MRLAFVFSLRAEQSFHRSETRSLAVLTHFNAWPEAAIQASHLPGPIATRARDDNGVETLAAHD